MYLKRTPKFFSKLFPQATWNYRDSGKVYLTFDDGPSDTTNELLDLLHQLDIKVSFFCLGQKAEEKPELIESIHSHGHTLGHHGYRHLSGWTTSYSDYIKDFEECRKVFSAEYYRPPFGRISPSQLRYITEYCQLIMWDVMPGDFDNSISADTLLRDLIKYSSPGSIIVLHDSNKTMSKLRFALPRFVEHIRNQGLDFGLIH